MQSYSQCKDGKAPPRTMELEVRKWDLFALSPLSLVLPGHHSQRRAVQSTFWTYSSAQISNSQLPWAVWGVHPALPESHISLGWGCQCCIQRNKNRTLEHPEHCRGFSVADFLQNLFHQSAKGMIHNSGELPVLGHTQCHRRCFHLIFTSIKLLPASLNSKELLWISTAEQTKAQSSSTVKRWSLKRSCWKKTFSNHLCSAVPARICCPKLSFPR